jgi:hypothetical protein
MADLFGPAAGSLLVGIVATWISYQVNSTSLEEFLRGNLITLLIALLAINTTTISVIMTKLREITDKTKVNFAETIHAMRTSITEQLILVILAIVLQILTGSKSLVINFPDLPAIVLVLMTAVFVYAIHVLYDTANSIFVILKFENDARV